MKEEAVLHLRNDVRELGRAAAELARFGEAHRLGEQAVFEITLALDEVLTNVIWYAYADGGEHEIVVRLGIDGDDVVVEVEDGGRPFDPLDVARVEDELERPVHERRVGGLGIHLVRRAMSGLAYRREMGKNILTMRRRVSEKE